MNIASLPVVTAYATTCHPVVFRRDSLAINHNRLVVGARGRRRMRTVQRMRPILTAPIPDATVDRRWNGRRR